MNYDGPILTDSGGYQVFSLAKPKDITEEGVKFKNHLNGDNLFSNLQGVLDGDLDRVVEPLILADREEKLKQSSTEEGK